ncbi:IS3 family transposase [Candidatus Phytoplasma oryzae]|nr:IS3 family transposase [Candidatus Phytoplasma oryzae]
MSPKIIKYYSLETKKAVVKAKMQGMKDKEIKQKFNLNTSNILYKWLRQWKITNYPHQKNQYSLETKLKAVFAKKEGWSNKKIQSHFGLKNITILYRWLKWFDQSQLHRLSQLRGKHYNDQKKFNNPCFKLIKKEIKQLLGINKKENKELYLKIVAKYSRKVGLNQLLKYLNLPKSTYYLWLKKISLIPHHQPFSLLEKAILKISKRNRYYNLRGRSKFLLGYRRLHLKLKLIGFKVNPKTVYQKMKKLACLCQTLKNYYYRGKNAYTTKTAFTNLLQNNFQAPQPYQKLVTDISYLPYGSVHNRKYLYLSAIMDLYNREIVAYQLAEAQNEQLVIQTLAQLPSFQGKNCLLHSDKGAPYVSNQTRKTIQAKGIKHSFSETGRPSQNSCIESFWSTLKSEIFYLEDLSLLTPQIIKHKVTRFIKYYNRKRRLKYLNYLSPLQFKQQHVQTI